MKICHVCWYCSVASGKTWASSWNVYKRLAVFYRAESKEQPEQGCSSREKELGDTGHHPTDLSRAVVTRAPSRWNGVWDAALSSELQQESSLRQAILRKVWGYIQGGQCLSSQCQGSRRLGWAQGHQQYNSGLDTRAQSETELQDTARDCGHRCKMRLVRAIHAYWCTPTLELSTNNLWGPRSQPLCAPDHGKIRTLLALFQAYH